MNAEEETRAASYRASLRARCLAETARARSLAGNPALRAELEANWEAYVLAVEEARKDDIRVEYEDRRREQRRFDPICR